jgi:hypothetical protein
MDGTLSAGLYIWFGCFVEYYWYPRFDYGTVYHSRWWDNYSSIPDNYPGNTNSNIPMNTNGFKLSMYFEYSAGESYTRTLTQGITFNDSLSTVGVYKRTLVQTINVTAILERFKILIYLLSETVTAIDLFGRFGLFARTLLSYSTSLAETRPLKLITSKIEETVQVIGTVFRGLLLFVYVKTVVSIRDYILSHFLKAKPELMLKSKISKEIILESKIR